MTAAQTLRQIRRRSGLSLRELARRAGTSHATLHAYEHGLKEPRWETLERIASAAGFAFEVDLAARADAGAARRDKGDELADVLLLAWVLPTRPRGPLNGPIFGRTR